MTLDVYRGRKTTIQQQQQLFFTLLVRHQMDLLFFSIPSRRVLWPKHMTSSFSKALVLCACLPFELCVDLLLHLAGTRPQLILLYSLIIHPSMRLFYNTPGTLNSLFLKSLRHDKVFIHSFNWAKPAIFSLFTP